MKNKLILIALFSSVILMNKTYSLEAQKNNENTNEKIPAGTLIPAKLMTGAEFVVDSVNLPLLAHISKFEVNKKLLLENCSLIFDSKMSSATNRVYGTAKEIICPDSDGSQREIKARVFLMDASRKNGLHGIISPEINIDLYRKNIDKNFSKEDNEMSNTDPLLNKRNVVDISADTDVFMIVTGS
jgi:hypothetical protein